MTVVRKGSNKALGVLSATSSAIDAKVRKAEAGLTSGYIWFEIIINGLTDVPYLYTDRLRLVMGTSFGQRI